MQEARIDALLAAMTLEEQVSMLAGHDFWSTVPIARLGIPSIKVSDGPNGARGGGSLVGGTKAAAFPAAIALAATWDVDLVRQIGAALGQEARAKGASVLLAPTVNIHRSTLNGRNFECYSEDPFLSAEIAVAYVTGVQGTGVAATIKHFIGNESEFQRNTISSEIEARTLREIYLAPFEAVVKTARVWALMTSYNRLNGTYVSEQAALLKGILREEWGFDGLVMSDWFGTQSTAQAMTGGLDLEMPGPARFRGDKLLAAVQAGDVSRDDVRDSVRRLLRLIWRVGALDHPAVAAEREDDRPEVRALIRRAGAQATVLLKNSGILPLAVSPGMTVAVIGPNAAMARIMGGGSAQLNPYYCISPLEGLRAALPAFVTISHEPGCTNARLVPQLTGDIVISFYEGTQFGNGGSPNHVKTCKDAFFMFMGAETPGFAPDNFSARLCASYTPTQNSEHAFSLIASGAARLFVDGDLVVDATAWEQGDEYFGTASDEFVALRPMEGGRTYQITVDYCSKASAAATGLKVLRVGLAPRSGEAEIARAVAAAQASDIALLFVGLNGEWDGEGKDRPDLDLPGRQNELIARVAAANPSCVVVLQSGGPITMPWLRDVAGVVQAWYPGQEAGNAIADVLLGYADPGGRLPQTFPNQLEDDPTLFNYPGDNGVVRYGEGIFIGYRGYEKRKLKPLFPFGFGLSYTQFQLGPLQLEASELTPGGVLHAGIPVTNSGRRAGSTIVQFYIRDAKASVARPPKELKGFAKATLEPGASQVLNVAFDMRALVWFDSVRQAWVAEAGEFELLAGFSSDNICARAPFFLKHDWVELCCAQRPSPQSSHLKGNPMSLVHPMSMQMYSARKFPPVADQLATAAQHGFTNIETFGPFYEDAGQSRRLLDEHGLVSVSGHYSVAMIDEAPEKVLELAKTLGQTIIVAPNLQIDQRPNDRAGYVAFGTRLSKAAAWFERKGMVLAWHNHDFEFAALADGSFPIEHILSPGLLWEADIAWITRAGGNPLHWIERYAAILHLVHIKDIAAGGEKLDEDGWADVGTGIVPWTDIWPRCVAAGAQIMVAEHDNPNDFGRFARVSGAAMSGYAKGKKS